MVVRYTGMLWRCVVMFAGLLAIATVLAFGIPQGFQKVAKVRGNPFVGHSDEASYALQGKSILQGRGSRIDYVSNFMISYPETITHREDHWPPLLGVFIAPCYAVFGVEAWVARLPGIFIASVFLPLAAGLITWALSRRGYAALFAAMVMMVAPQVYGQSMRVLSDGLTALMVAGFCGCLLLAVRRPWLYVVAGVFMAGAVHAKGSELMLLGLYPVLAWMTATHRVFRSRWFYCGLGAAVLLLAPTWYANWRDYGHPLHTTQRYVSGFYGIEPVSYWERGMYYPYWGRDLPKVSDRWTKHPDYAKRSRGQLVAALQYVLAGGSGSGDITSDFGEWGVKVRDFLADRSPATEPATAPRSRRNRAAPAPAIQREMKSIGEWHAPVWQIIGGAGIVLVLGAGTLALARGINNVVARIRRSSTPKRTTPSATRAILAVAVLAFAHAAFLAYFWRVDSRFCFPILPLVLSLGVTGFVIAFEWIFVAAWRGGWVALRRLGYRGAVKGLNRVAMAARFWPVAATILFALVVLVGRSKVLAIEQRMLDREGARPPMIQLENRYVVTGKWIREKLPEAIVMCRNPWELLFYMGPGNKGVGLPAPDAEDPLGAEKIFAIARYYRVTHLLDDTSRPALRPYVYGYKPGLKRVAGSPRDLYELDYSQLPGATVDEVFLPKR